jgi:hypothetical protein
MPNIFSAAAIISRVISPLSGVIVGVGEGVIVGVGELVDGRDVLVGSRVGLDEQACESNDEMLRVDKSCKNPLRSSMVGFSLLN